MLDYQKSHTAHHNPPSKRLRSLTSRFSLDSQLTPSQLPAKVVVMVDRADLDRLCDDAEARLAAFGTRGSRKENALRALLVLWAEDATGTLLSR